MKTLSFILLTSLITMGSSSLQYDFGNQSLNEGWSVINDGVMGGLSDGSISYSDQSLLFTGTLSFENNGGFSRIKHQEKVDASAYTEVVLRVRGDGRKYGVMLEPSLAYYKPHYRANFNTVKDEWTEVVVPLNQFTQRIMERSSDQPISKTELQNLQSLGLVVTGSPEGAFKLEIDRIAFR